MSLTRAKIQCHCCFKLKTWEERLNVHAVTAVSFSAVQSSLFMHFLLSKIDGFPAFWPSQNVEFPAFFIFVLCPAGLHTALTRFMQQRDCPLKNSEIVRWKTARLSVDARIATLSFAFYFFVFFLENIFPVFPDPIYADFPKVSVFPGDFEFSGIVCSYLFLGGC